MNRARKLRRQNKAEMKYGANAGVKRKHRRIKGRTGQIQAKKNHSPKVFEYSSSKEFQVPAIIDIISTKKGIKNGLP